MKIWAGRQTGETNKDADGFNSSLPFDKKLYRCDILGSIAHATMLGKCGIISQEESGLICAALKTLLADIESGKVVIDNAEDIHSFVETKLVKDIGDVGKKVHTGRSRNDQVALDMRLYLRDSIDVTVSLTKKLISVLLNAAKENTDSIMPAFTHLQKAQPTTLAHHLLAYCEMLLRDIDRMLDAKKRVNVLPLGSGACTSTPHPIDREYVAKLLDFPAVTRNSLDGVSDRDFVLDYLYAASVEMMHLSRISEEFIIWASDEYRYVELSDNYSTGSSAMPQKKNPDFFELIRGKSGRTYGNLIGMLTVLKSLPLAYNKDMQEDKEAFFDTELTLQSSLNIMAGMLSEIKFNTGRMRSSTDSGFTSATDCADYLTCKGVPFRDAYKTVGKLVGECAVKGKILQSLTLDEYKKASPLFESDIFEVIKPENAIAKRTATGGPAKSAVLDEIVKIEKRLSE